MPLPVVLFKLYLVLKILKYPIAAAIDSLREYRRREQFRDRRLHVVASRHFFHHPIRALRDGRFWRKCLTNAAEIVIHISALFALVWNLARRLTCDGYVSWRPHHTPERELYALIEHERWGVAFRRTGKWLADAFRRWPGARTVCVELRGPARRGGWVELRFDGGYVMVCGGRRGDGKPVVIRRPESGYYLEAQAGRRGPVTIVVRRDGGAVVRSICL